jgi:succinate-semialdehyde dehydrogenase/glutarate-semialdehyde dehydrogenase
MGEVISYNPATLEELGSVPITTANEVAHVVQAARRAQPAWQGLGFAQRARHILRARQYLLDNIDSFAETITRDNGKPLAESLTAEIYPVADLMHYFARNAERMLAGYRQPIGIMGSMLRSSRIEHAPLGVIGIISPWNYPFSIPAGEVVMSLMAGNAVLLKPSSITPLVGAKIAEMIEAAELPAGVFAHIPGDSSTGRALISAGTDKILFTGSVGVGKKIMASCAETLTPVQLELGGKDPMIVRADADIDHASSGAVWGAFTNCGQTCASVERVYVHEKVYDAFVAEAVAKTRALKLGNGMEPGVDVGPLTNESQMATTEAHVRDAAERGATVACGGKRVEATKGYFYEPTVLTGVDHSYTCMREETFGPLLPIVKVADDEEAVRLANDSPFGLTASVWTRDIGAGKAMARRINAGTVTVNEAVYTFALCQTPWGGVKESGIGRSHARIGLLELVRPHHVHVNRWQRKSMWWYPYAPKMVAAFKGLARTLTGGVVDKIKSLPYFLKVFLLRKR